MRAALVLLALAATSLGCRKSLVHTSVAATKPDTLIAGTVINAPGTWTASTPRGSRKLDVTVSGTSVSWSITSEEKHPGGGSSSGSSSSGMTVSSPSDPWFIFVESPTRLWFCNGKNELNYSLSDGGGSRSGPAIFSGQRHPTAEVIPLALVPHLPPDMQKLFPPVEPPAKRPSF
jgi:hypothetical protein